MAAVLDRGLDAFDDRNRPFAFAVVASILVHALALLALPGLFDPSRSKGQVSAPIVARLVQPRPLPAPAFLPPVEPAPRPKMEDKPQAVRKPSPTRNPLASPVAPPLTSALPAPQQVSPSVETPRAADQVQPAPAPVAGAPSARVEPPTPAPATTSSAADPTDALTLGQYRIAIITAARRYKKYPRVALDNNWEGQAEIRMVIDADGNIGSIRFKTRSGFEILDQQALEMIRKAKPLTPIPAALRGRGFTVDIPVVFSLKEEAG